MNKKITSVAFALIMVTGCVHAENNYSTPGMNLYNLDGDDMPYFTTDNNKEDLVDLSNINCEWSHGGTTECRTYLSPTYNFPKDSLKVQKEIVRSGDVAFKFVNGEGDCGYHKSMADCGTHRERSEISMQALQTTDTWFKFSIFIPDESEFHTPIGNAVWQIHLKNAPPIFMIRVGPRGDLMWSDFVNNDFGGVTYKKMLDAKYVKGQWNDFVVNINFVDYPNKSYIKAWVNDNLVINYDAHTNSMFSDQPYMKFGIYKSHINRYDNMYKGKTIPKRGDSIVYYDAIAIGDNCKELKLQNEGNSCNNLK